MRLLFSALTLLFVTIAVSCSRQPTEKSAEQIWQDDSGSIVYVTAQGVDGKVAQGSGFFVKLEGKRWILTNRHVVNGAEQVAIAPQGKTPKRAGAYKISPDLDLAVIECPADLDAKPLPLAKDDINPGAEVFVLGYPLGIANVISRGIVGAVEDKYFLFDAPISSGNSGGPVVNRAGQVIGVATLGSHSVDGAVVQNLNVGIRVAAVPRLQLFTDPLVRISNVAERIRETERFIEQGFVDGDFLALGQLLSNDWLEKEADASAVATQEWKQKVADHKQQRAAWEARHGPIRDNVKHWAEFLKKCEEHIDAIPAAFAGIGNDSLLAQFLKDERSFKLSDRINARPEILPELARISADHWLARLEDLRYHLEWFLKYSRLPTMAEMQLLEKLPESKRQRPTIRLNVSITGNADTDLRQYLETLVEWKHRDDVWKDDLARMSHGYADTFFPSAKNRYIKSEPPVADPIQSEKFHGDFLGQVSSMWAYLATAAADRGNLDEAIRMLQRDLKDRPPSHYSGGLLAVYFVGQGKFDDAWRAYRKHLICDPPFHARDLQQSWSGMSYSTSHFLSYLVEGMDLSIEFKNFPEILRHVDEWNEQITTVGGREFKILGSMSDTLSSSWFSQLDDLDKLRVLYYFRVTRPHDEEAEQYTRTGKVRDSETLVRQQEEFTSALDVAPEAKAVWTRATLNRGLDPPL
jgi:tetratricopeptide (TPR) repeat protein